MGGNVGGSIVTGDNNSVTQIRNVYLGASGRPALSKKEFDPALGRYLGWVEQRYGRLSLRGVEKREQKALTLTLDDLYVSLAAVLNPERQDRWRKLESGRVVPIDMGRRLPVNPRLVIIDGSGGGKTTYLHLTASILSHAIRTN